MRRRSPLRGAILIEFLIAMLCALLVGASLAVLIKCTYSSQTIVMGDNLTYVSVRKTMDVLAAHLSNAQAYQSSASVYQVFSAAGQTSVTIYTDTAGDTEQYWFDNATSSLKKTTVVGTTTTTTTVVNNVHTLTFKYFWANDASNYTVSSWANSGNSVPSGNLPFVGAVQITATVTVNGSYSRQLTSYVRLRNSPYRS